MRYVLIGLLSLYCLISALNPISAQSFPELHRLGFIVVTPNGSEDGGDFGPKTEGTKTAGIQEALDHAKSLNTGQHSNVNLYIAKGRYQTHEAIFIPWMGEKFRIQAEESWIEYRSTTGNAMTIDSQMNSRLEFGYVSGVNLIEGWIVRVAPVDPGPSAPLPQDRQKPVIVSTLLKFNAIVARAYFKEGEPQQRCSGLLLDASRGPIVCSKVDISELNTCDVGVELRGNCTFNDMTVWFLHGCNTHLLVGDRASHNHIVASINSENVPTSTGVQLFGQKNTLRLTIAKTAKDRGVVFEPPARDNVVYTSDTNLGFTNDALTPTNRIVSNTPVGFSIDTPETVHSGQSLVNRYPHDVEITIVKPGDVQGWSLTDSTGTVQKIDAGLTAGQQLRLAPGEAISLHYKERPTWRWRAAH